MNTTIRKSAIYFSLGLILIAGLISCTSEKGSTSYPVAKLNPERIAHRHFLQRTNHRKTYDASEKIHNQNTVHQDIAIIRNSKSSYRIPVETDRKYDLATLYRDDLNKSNNDDQNLLASTSNEPDIRLVKPGLSKYTHQPIIKEDTVAQRATDNNERYTKQKKDRKEMNGFGIVSLVTGIVGIVVPYLAPVAIVFGAIGLNKRLRGLAIAGMVLGIITIMYYVLLFILFFSIFM
jgi:hypothetical protein